MNWTRGGLRLWVVVSLCWTFLFGVLAWGKWTTGLGCALAALTITYRISGPWCLYWGIPDYVRAFAPFAAMPIGLLMLVLAGRWITEGFRRT
jgi:hypothetical protein